MPIISVGNKEVLTYLKSQPYYHEFKENVLHEEYEYYIRVGGTIKDAKVAKFMVLLGGIGNDTIATAFDWKLASHRDMIYWSEMDDYIQEEVFLEKLFKKKYIKSTKLDRCYYYDNS